MFLVFAALCLVLVQVTYGRAHIIQRRNTHAGGVFDGPYDGIADRQLVPVGIWHNRVGTLIGVNFLLANLTSFNKAIQICWAVFIPQVNDRFGRGHGR